VDVRPMEDRDEREVLELLSLTLGPGPAGERSAEFFRWKHLQNPFGRSLLLVAEIDGRIAGLRALMRWRLGAGEREYAAAIPVDTATHPDFQGMGIFTRLTRAALDILREDTDLVFNTPNEKSLPGYLKMGWRTAGRVPVSIRVRRPLRLAVALALRRSGGSATRRAFVNRAKSIEAVLDQDPQGIAALLQQTAPQQRLHTVRDLGYLRWRYQKAPFDYRALTEKSGSEVEGVVVFRVRPRSGLSETTIAEVIVRPGTEAAGRLLRRAVTAADVDHVTASVPRHINSAASARRAGFLPTHLGITLAVNPLRKMDLDASSLDNWALSLGDLEVF
jgi:GNAT superfamily N-acetyltransferase